MFSDFVSVAYPTMGVVVSSVGNLFVVQDLQGRIIELAITTSVRGETELYRASSASTMRRARQKASNLVDRRRRARMTDAERRARNKQDVERRRVRRAELAAARKAG